MWIIPCISQFCAITLLFYMWITQSLSEHRNNRLQDHLYKMYKAAKMQLTKNRAKSKRRLIPQPS